MALNLAAIAPYLGVLGNVLSNIDENKTGADDLAGDLLQYAAGVIVSIQASADLPPVPDSLLKGATDKITGIGRVILQSASAILALAQFQVHGKAAIALKYVNQILVQLLAGQPISPMPADVRTALQGGKK